MSKIQSIVDTYLKFFAVFLGIIRRHNPFGHKERAKFGIRKWTSGFRKFIHISPFFFMGSMPASRGLKRLKRIGIKTIINLRSSLDYRDIAECMGFNYLHLPLNGKRPPLREQIAMFLEIMQDNACLPVFIHCNRARHRASMMLGIYRIMHDKWDAETAIAEIRYLGLKKIPEEVISFFQKCAYSRAE